MPSTITDRLNGLTTSVAVKAPCRVATTAAITLSGLQTIDSAELASGDRVLVKNQADPVVNGIWNARTGPWVRATDFDGSRDAVGGTLLFVQAGTVNGNYAFRISGTSSQPIAIGSDEIEFEVAFQATFDAAQDAVDAAAAASASAATATAAAAAADADADQVAAQYAEIVPLAAQVAADAIEVAGLHDAIVDAVIASIVDTPPAANYAAGLAAVADDEAFFLTSGGRRYYYIRIDASNADLFQVTLDDRDLQNYATLAAAGDTESAPPSLDIDFASVDALTRPAAVPNRAKGSLSLNLLASNRPGDTGVWEQLSTTGAGLTAVTRNVTGLIAGNYAMRVQYAASSTGIIFADLFFPPGQWSLVATLKAASGTPGFRAGLNGATGLAAVSTSPTPTRTIMKTENFTTFGVRQIRVFQEAASPVSADITIDDLYIVPGDGTVVPAQVLGIAPVGDRVTLGSAPGLITSGATAATSSMYMLAPLGDGPVSAAAFSVVIALKHAGSSGANQVLWGFATSNNYLLYDDSAGWLTMALASPSFSKEYREVPPPLDEFIILGIVHTGTEVRLYVDGVRFDTTAHALDPISAHGLTMFGHTMGYNVLGETASFQAVMNYAAGDAEMASMARVARKRIVSAGGAFRGCGIVPAFEGDSITANYLAAGLTRAYPSRTVSAYTPAIQAANFAVSGNTFAQVLARLYTHVIPMCNRAMAAGKAPVVILHVGANDYGGWTTAGQGTAYASDIATQYFDPLMQRGIPVIASTIMANNDLDGTKIAYRNAANVQFRALAAAGRCAALADYAGDSNLNVWNSTYFGDSLHPKDAGAALMATILKAALDPFVALYR